MLTIVGDRQRINEPRSLVSLRFERHCEEPLRRSNPGAASLKPLDCFAPLAMTDRAFVSLQAPTRHMAAVKTIVLGRRHGF